MAFEKHGYAYYSQLLQASQATVSVIKQSRLVRIHGILRRLYLYPLFSVYTFFLLIVSVISKNEYKRRRIALSRFALSRYFISKGVHYYTPTKLTAEFPPKSIIFATRDHPYSSLFIHHLFSECVIVPLTFRNTPFFCSGIKYSSYPDQPLPSSLPTIERLLDAGYPTVVFINKGFSSTSQKIAIYCYADMYKLMERPGSRPYFLSVQGLDRFDSASINRPIFNSVKIETHTSLLGNTPLNTKESHEKIASFMGFRYRDFA